MPTVIDELIVRLGIDATGLRQGQTTAAGAMRQLQETFRRYSDDIGRSTNALSGSLHTLRFGYEAIGIAALAAFAKVEQFATKVAAQNVTLAANAAAVRETTEEYSALGRALEAAIPGGGGGFARTVQNITNALAETRYTGKPTGIAQAAITFGLPLTESSVDTATGLVRRHYIDAQQLAFNFIDKLKAKGKDYADAVWWAERYGIDKTLVYMRYKLTEEQQRQIAAQGELNKLTQAQADASERLWIQWQGLEGTIGRVNNVTLEKFEKQFSTIIKYATSFADLFASKIIPGVAAVWDHLNKTVPENSWMRKWDFGLLGYLKELVDKLTFVDKIIDKIFGEGTSKKTPLADLGRAADKAIGTEPGGPVDQATGGAISNMLGRTPVPEIGTPGRPAYEPLYPHRGYTPPAPAGAGGTTSTGPQSALPPQSSGVDRSQSPSVANYTGQGTDGVTGLPRDVLRGAYQALAGGAGPQGLKNYLDSVGVHRDLNWCGDFAGAVFKHAGIKPPKGYPIASNWRTVGPEVPAGQEREGDIAVRRGPITGNAGSHVGIVTGTPNKGYFDLLAGNQGRAVARDPESRYQFYRPMLEAAKKLNEASSPATRASIPAVGDSRWNGAPLSAVSMWGANGGATTNNNDNSRSSEVHIGVFNQNVGSSTMVGSAHDFMGAVKESSTAIQAEGGPQ